MSKIDLYDPKWIEMVFEGKNKEYGAYVLRSGTSSRNLKSLLILLIAAALIGGYLVYKIQADKAAAERAAYMEQLELSKLQEQAKKCLDVTAGSTAAKLVGSVLLVLPLEHHLDPPGIV